MSATIAIVDPFFSGENFPAIAESMGYRALWIRSNPAIPMPDPAVLPAHFVRYDGDIEKLAALCREMEVRAAFAGCENGVLLADALSEMLSLPSNGTALSRARRHKGEMKKAFAAAGVPCARFSSIRSFDAADARAAMAEVDLRFPVVIKPPMGFSTLGVFTCEDEAALDRGLAALAALDLSPYGIGRDEILIEEYIGGDEFIVDTLGEGDVIHITDAWRYEKITFRGRHHVYRSAHLLPHGDPRIGRIVPAALDAVRALGIRIGPAHVELKLSPAGPRIIEVGARIVGVHLADLVKVATGRDIERATVSAFLGGKADLAGAGKPWKHAAVVVLMTAANGEIRGVRGVPEIERLPSFVRHRLRTEPGQRVQPTADLITSPGLVYLAHERADQVADDVEACHRLFALEVIP